MSTKAITRKDFTSLVVSEPDTRNRSSEAKLMLEGAIVREIHHITDINQIDCITGIIQINHTTDANQINCMTDINHINYMTDRN